MDNNGALQEKVSLLKHQRHGLGIEYYQNGKIKSEIEYKYGNPDGKVKLYDEARRVTFEGRISAKWRSGVRKKYYDDGRIHREYKEKEGAWGKVIMHCDNGKFFVDETVKDQRVSGIKYDRNGNKIGNISYDIKNAKEIKDALSM